MQRAWTVAYAPFFVGAACILAGVALLWAYARVAWPWAVLGWIGLVPWSWLWMQHQSLRAAFATSVVCSIAFVGSTFDWFAQALAEYTGLSAVTARIALYLSSPLLEPQFIALAFVLFAFRQRPKLVSFASTIQRALAAAAVYTACERIVPTKFLGDTLGLGLLGALPWAQAADLGGVHLLTFFLVFANVLLAHACGSLHAQHSRRFAAALLGTVASLMAALWVYGSWRIRSIDAQAGERNATVVRVGAVQGNISHYDQLREKLGTFAAVRLILDRYFTLTRPQVEQADFWVWPETVYPTTFGKPKSPDGALFDREIAAFVQIHARPLVLGAYDRDEVGEYNAAFFLIPDAGAGLHTEVYRKVYPFPWTEHVPSWADYGFVRRWLPWLGTWKPGREIKVVSLPLGEDRTIRVAPLICYDALMPALSRAAARSGAELLLTMSNDSWFSGVEGKRLSLVGAVFRSIETHRPQIRVTPTGITAVIDAVGRFRILMPPDRPQAAIATLVLPPPRWSLATEGGHRWFLIACLAATFMGAGSWLRSGPPKRKSGSGSTHHRANSSRATGISSPR